MGAQIFQKSIRHLKILQPEIQHKANSILRHNPTTFYPLLFAHS